MYVVRILYPRTEGSTFNLKHYLDVHTPLGLGLLRERTGVVPVRVEVDAEPNVAGAPAGAFHCASSLYFETEEDLAAFHSLSAMPDAAEQLAADFDEYTTNPPVISVAQVVGIDPRTHRALAAAPA